MPIGMQPSAPARVERLMIMGDTGLPMHCNTLDCDRMARSPYQIRMHEHSGRYSCSQVEQSGGGVGRHAHHVFCSERCLMYFLWGSGWRAKMLAERYNGRQYGMLPPGMRLGRYR